MIYSETDDVTRDLSSMSVDEREEELCQLVINALFTIMWRGGNKTGALSDDVIKERGQVKFPFKLKNLFFLFLQIFVEFQMTFTQCVSDCGLLTSASCFVSFCKWHNKAKTCCWLPK